MNYEDEERLLDEEIRAELRRLRAAEEISESSPNVAELRSILQNSPIQKTVRDLPLSSYLRKMRIYSEATVETFAGALGIPVAFIEQLEINGSQPWLVSPVVMARIVQRIRLHIRCLEILTENSHTIARVSKTLQDPDVGFGLMTKWLEEVASELRRHGAGDLLEQS